MSNTISLITAEREHLFDLATEIVEAIDPVLMQDKNNPVIVCVRGALESGKKIIPDAARHALLHDRWSFEGRPEYDEYWIGKRHGRKIEIDFINLAWTRCFYKPTLQSPSVLVRARKFLAERQFGGISFIHNNQRLSREIGWIDIWMEDGRSPIVQDRRAQHQQQSHLKYRSPSLVDTFNGLAKRNAWTRYIEISVRNEQLLRSTRFQDAMSRLSLRDDLWSLKEEPPRIKRQPSPAVKRDVPVYGVNIPR